MPSKYVDADQTFMHGEKPELSAIQLKHEDIASTAPRATPKPDKRAHRGQKNEITGTQKSNGSRFALIGFIHAAVLGSPMVPLGERFSQFMIRHACRWRNAQAFDFKNRRRNLTIYNFPIETQIRHMRIADGCNFTVKRHPGVRESCPPRFSADSFIVEFPVFLRQIAASSNSVGCNPCSRSRTTRT